MGAYDGGIEHLHKMSRLAQCRQRIEESFESPGPAQAPEPLPDAVPLPKLFRESPPSDVVNHEILQGFEKPPIVPPLSPRRERDASNTLKTIVQSSSVIVVSMVGPPNRPPMSHRKSDLGILYPIAWLNPSTRPSSYRSFTCSNSRCVHRDARALP